MSIRHRPKLGQNFLISPTAQTAIADALGDLSGRTVVEIGPGRGAITHILARRARRLIAVEFDPALAAQLQADFSHRPGVTILHRNILATDLAAVAREAHAGIEASANPERFSKLLIVGNLPYYITSDILLHLFAAHSVIERAVVMIQREVADRVAAHPGSRDYGLLSVTAQLYARAEKLFTLPPAAFSPPPQVHSTVLRLTMQPRLEELGLTGSVLEGHDVSPNPPANLSSGMDRRAASVLKGHDVSPNPPANPSSGMDRRAEAVSKGHDVNPDPPANPSSGMDRRAESVLKGHDFSRAEQDPKEEGTLAPEHIRPGTSGADPAAPFLHFLRMCFAQKRKTLANNLRAAGYAPDAIAAALAASAIAPQSRAEQLDLPTLAAVYARLRGRTL